MTICHRTPGGQEQTLILPRSAALAHLMQHPLDTVGACPVASADTTPSYLGLEVEG